MMTNALVVSRELDKVRRDLDDAAFSLGNVSKAEDHGAVIDRLTYAAEALMRAVSSVSLALERLAELPMCDGGHEN